ncbi:MAG: VIT domain-containing protein [Calditrichia bacterium]
MKTTFAIVAILIFSAVMFAQGRIIIPERPPEVAPASVHLKQVNATVNLKSGVGNISLEQYFYNPNPVRLEGEYIFPLPAEAQVHDFNLYINGQRTKGEILDSREAARIYENIVRKLRDPALLEYTGQGLFKARIFPIEPRSERRIDLTYAQVVNFEGGTYRFTLPIRQCGQGSIENFHLTINLEEQGELANIYSPSHNIRIEREGKNRARISVEETRLPGDKDFVLYYSVAKKEINTTLLTFRPRTDRDGYFILLASPQLDVYRKRAVPKDFIFVIDVSGSMAGEKIQQAREGLRFCVNSLNPEDRFEIIRFSSRIENFQNGLKHADSEAMKNAGYFIDNLGASGGTNINAALTRALSLKSHQDDRPTSIVFLTDGLPTEGETDVKRILQNVKNAGKDFIRIFSFGVGYDVNTFLLDKLSGESHGSANYLRPGENIEKEISAFFAKISSPVLTDPQFDFGSLAIYDVYPQKTADIFRGQRVSIIGRYGQPGNSRIILTGKQGNRTRSFEYEVNFKRRETENKFIAKLWANRKVAHLLEQIRFNGENPELVESIKNIALEYGIVTPYTSYLVTEQERELQQVRRDISMGSVAISKLRLSGKKEILEYRGELDEESIGSAGFYDAMSAAPAEANKSSGKDAVVASRVMKSIAASEKEEDMLITVKRIYGKTFHLKNGYWVEKGLNLDTSADRIITFLSDDYFRLSKQNEQISKILALGEKVIFSWKGVVYKINRDVRE